MGIIEHNFKPKVITNNNDYLYILSDFNEIMKIKPKEIINEHTKTRT